MRTMSNDDLMAKACPDCGQLYASAIAHSYVCEGKTNDINELIPPGELEAVEEMRSFAVLNDIDPGDDPAFKALLDGVEGRVPEELLADARIMELDLPPNAAQEIEKAFTIREDGEVTEYTCSFCKAEVRQDSTEDIPTDLKGRAVCSSLCQDAANMQIQAGIELDKRIVEAVAVYVKLDREEHIHKAFYKARAAALVSLHDLIGVGGHFQDEAGTVYEIAEKRGQWVDFTPYEMHRTRRDNDASGKGSMTLDRAEELGYEIERKRAKAKAKTAPHDPAPGKYGEEDIPN